ncbi:MAG: FHA domain-containing protein [Chloroflexi bacterium]|nr:MAG: FHA domain-containing protein [Chloroflexota bacterium]
MSSTANLVGQTLGGYQLVEAVGYGAMATVYKAFQPTLDRWVAVKVLQYKEARAMVRFEREAKAIALLRHQNILIVYEYGQQNNVPYIVMEYVEGGSLADRLAAQTLSWPQAVNLVIPLAQALHYAHQQGIIHRDVKPSNVLLPRPDWPLLADFGLAKLSDEQHTPVTRTGTSLGTPAYVAPEQARGLKVDHRTDIYSLGVILFEAVTGSLPFNYSNPNKMLLAHISETPPRPAALNPDCPPALEAAILRAMEKSPDNRYQDMGQFVADLQTVQPQATPPVAQSVARPATAASPLRTVEIFDTTIPMASTPPAGPTDARILLTDKNITLSVPQQNSVIVGRTHKNSVADIDLGPHGAAQAGISRRHARLFWRNSQWWIEDLGSLNGTFVNGTAVPPDSPVPLKNGDVVRCSHMSFVFLTADNG